MSFDPISGLLHVTVSTYFMKLLVTIDPRKLVFMLCFQLIQKQNKTYPSLLIM